MLLSKVPSKVIDRRGECRAHAASPYHKLSHGDSCCCSWPLPQPKCKGGSSGHGHGLQDHRTTTGQVSMSRVQFSACLDMLFSF